MKEYKKIDEVTVLSLNSGEQLYHEGKLYIPYPSASHTEEDEVTCANCGKKLPVYTCDCTPTPHQAGWEEKLSDDVIYEQIMICLKAEDPKHQIGRYVRATILNKLAQKAEEIEKLKKFDAFSGTFESAITWEEAVRLADVLSILRK